MTDGQVNGIAGIARTGPGDGTVELWCTGERHLYLALGKGKRREQRALFVAATGGPGPVMGRPTLPAEDPGTLLEVALSLPEERCAAIWATMWDSRAELPLSDELLQGPPVRPGAPASRRFEDHGVTGQAWH